MVLGARDAYEHDLLYTLSAQSPGLDATDIMVARNNAIVSSGLVRTFAKNK